MSASPNITDDPSHESGYSFAPRTPKIIGRTEYIETIKQAIADKPAHSYVFYFVGPGGIGKTRILEEVEVIQQGWSGTPFRWSSIIDLYHADFHSPSGLRRAITDGLDPDNHYFQGYRKLRQEFEQKREEGIPGPQLEASRQQLDTQFQKEYESLAEEYRLVLCFDTLEFIQYESDAVQKICQVEDVDTVIKNWLLDQVSHFPNTVTLFAGRPRPKVQVDFEQGFTQAKRDFKLCKLEVLTSQETQEYLNAMSEQRPELAEMLTPETCKEIIRISAGRPIRLTLLIDLLLSENPLGQIFSASAETIDKLLLENLLFLPDPFDYQMIHFLMHARKSLDSNLLRHLVDWEEDDIKANMARMRQFAIVKTRPGTEQLLLHDEVYELFDRYFRDDSRFGREVTSIAQYYRHQLERAASIQEREELRTALLYYELQLDVRTGYRYYARWDEEAIKSHESGLDMRLQDEALRFLDRYINSESRFYDQRIADRLEQAVIDRDSAVRWVKRHLLTRRDFKKARQVAKNLRSSKHPTFDWDTVDDPFYKAGLLTAWGEAMLYLGDPETEVRETLDQAVQILENDREWEEEQRWWRARILGRAHNNIGYLYRTQGRFGLALQHYRRALPYFREANIPDEQADTQNNLAYLLALLGRTTQARRHIEAALKIRVQIGRQYPIALSRNTLGRIHVLSDHPKPGEQECRKALRICEELQESRGIGLACNGLGFALRKRGDQWKHGEYSQEEAENYFQEAIQYFQRAVNTFSKKVPEPIRLWEAYNEWGSLYCDWAWLTRHRQDDDQATLHQAALRQYAQAIKYQTKALNIAQARDLEFQIADSYDDLAQVYGDQSFLFIQMGQLGKAKQSREEAKGFLDQVEEMVPETFHLLPDEGFGKEVEPAQAYLQSLGKAHLWRGIWAFRDLEANVVPDQEREDVLRQATHQLILALAYFQHYWPASYAVGHTLDYFSDFLQVVDVPADWAREQVRSIANEYQVGFDVLDNLIDDLFGL